MVLSKDARDSLSKEDFEILRQYCRDTKVQIEKLFDDLILRDPMNGDYAVDLAADLIRKICEPENSDAHINLMMVFEHLIGTVCLVAREQGLFE